jgi:hypothetical protein
MLAHQTLRNKKENSLFSGYIARQDPKLFMDSAIKTLSGSAN